VLVRFITIETFLDNESPLLLNASKRLAGHIRRSPLYGLDDSNIHMIFAKEIEMGTYEFVYAFGHFSIEEIEKEIDFPELAGIDAHDLSEVERPPTITGSPSIIANVGRIVNPLQRDEPIPF